MRCHSVGCVRVSQKAVSNAIDYANSGSRSHDPVIRVYDSAGESDHADDGLHPQPILSIENDKWVGHGKVTAHAVFEKSESIVPLVAWIRKQYLVLGASPPKP
jgi:hypothetical protein